MSKVLFVISSVRENRAADKIVEQIQAELVNFPAIEASYADFKQLPLPFFDASANPAQEGFEPEDKNVRTWTKMVEEADKVVLLVAEYNHSYTAVLKNAIDWMAAPWRDKPVAYIGYGWAGGSRAIKHLRDVMGSTLSASQIEAEANLHFKKEIDLDGSPIDDTASKEILKVLQEL